VGKVGRTGYNHSLDLQKKFFLFAFSLGKYAPQLTHPQAGRLSANCQKMRKKKGGPQAALSGAQTLAVS